MACRVRRSARALQFATFTHIDSAMKRLTVIAAALAFWLTLLDFNRNVNKVVRC